MARVSTNVARNRRKKKIMKLAKGYWGARSRWYKLAKEAVIRAHVYAYRDRRTKKRESRMLWIARINAAARLHGLSYSMFISGLKKAGINLNRKMLAEIAVSDTEGFSKLVEVAKQSHNITSVA
jgi:large subunit ribosomal protein L20